MMIVYTPGEATKTLVSRFRLPKAAKDTFNCEWLINRDENMNFVLQRGLGDDKQNVRVCLMTGRTEPITQEMAEQVGMLLSQLLSTYDKRENWIQFGFTKGEGSEASEHLKNAKLRILQELKLNKECITV